MQRYLLDILLRPLAALALSVLAVLAPTLHAAELGDVAARSYIGQPLSADVELLAGDGGPVQARLAQPDVYRGANITMNPALASVRMAVARRDGKDVLHITTAGAVNAEYVHVYVELNAGGRRDIRLATVWLQPDPNPAPPVRVAPAVVAPAAIAAAEPARMADSAAPAPARAVRDRTRPAPMPSFHETEVGGPGGLKAAAAQARPPSLVPVREIPERISEALGSRLIGPARVAEKPAPAAAGKPAADSSRLADQPAANTAGARASRLAEKLAANGVTRSADKVTASGASKPVEKTAEKTAEKLASKADSKLAAKPEGAAAKPEAVAAKPEAASAKHEAVATKTAAATTPAAVASTPATSAPPPQVAQALLPMPPLPLPVGVKKAAAPAACAPGSSGAKECQALDAQSQALSTKLVELEGKVKQLQTALAGATGAAAAAPVASKMATPMATPPTPAAPAAKPLTIASGMGEARAAEIKPETPVAAKPAAPAPVPKAEAGVEGAKVAAKETAVPAPVQQRRVLPKLKYKKEKPPEEQSSKLPLILGGLAAALLAGAGVWLYLRRKKSGKPLKIWQGFRKKPRTTEAAGDEFREVPTPDWAAPGPAVQP